MEGGDHIMPIQYKIDIMQALKDAGYNTNRIRQEKLIGQATLQQIRHGKLVSWATMETICELLQCQPGDLIEYISNEPFGESRNGHGEQKESSDKANQDLSDIALYRLEHDPLYQIDMAQIYGMNVLADLLEQARQQSSTETEE